MKHQFFLGFLLCVCANCITFAQNPVFKDTTSRKTSLFAGLPTKSLCNRSELEKIRQMANSAQVTLDLADNLVLSGELVEKVETTGGNYNVNIRLSNFGKALFHISFVKQIDNGYKITGRIIHPKNADALVIAEENGKYYITKYKMEFFMVE